MPQQPEQFQEFHAFSPQGRARGTTRAASFETAGRSRPLRMRRECAQALRLLAVLAMGAMLAACGRCGDFLGSSQSQIGACHSDRPQP